MGYGSNEINVQSPAALVHRRVAVRVEFESKSLKPGFHFIRFKGWVTRRFSSYGWSTAFNLYSPAASCVDAFAVAVADDRAVAKGCGGGGGAFARNGFQSKPPPPPPEPPKPTCAAAIPSNTTLDPMYEEPLPLPPLDVAPDQVATSAQRAIA
jgi:hypothetical protein